MMDKLLIGIVSTHTESELQSKINRLIKDCGCECKVDVRTNKQGRGLTLIYNEILVDNADYDRFLFIHDDLDIHTLMYGMELNRLFDEYPEYGIIGVAGTASLDGTCKWWNGNKDCHGKVIHDLDTKSGNKKYMVLFNDEDEELSEVCCLDGLFIAVDCTRIKKPFNEEFDKFHFYDISFCIDNFLEGVKIGVTTNIRVAHHSAGDSDNPVYRQYQNKMRHMYSHILPIEKLKINGTSTKDIQ